MHVAYPHHLRSINPKRNVALIVVGALMLLVAAGAGILFLINFYQYVTIADRWANEPRLIPEAREFGVRLIRGAAMNRMTVFGPLSAAFGVPGLVLGILGLRKR